MTRADFHRVNAAFHRVVAARSRAERRKAEIEYLAALRETGRRKEQR